MPRSPDASEILSAIRAVAHQLGRAPTRAEFTRLSGISHFQVLARFPSLREAIRRAGFEPNPQGLRISSAALLEDWCRVARKLRCLPSRSQYLRHGRYSAGVFSLRFGSWTAIQRSFLNFARDNDNDGQWKDVLELIVTDNNEEKASPGNGMSLSPGSIAKDAYRPAPLPPPLAGQKCVTQLVLAMIVDLLAPAHVSPDGPAASRHSKLSTYQLTQLPTSSLLRDRPVLGAPLSLPGLAYEPANESGVVFLFGMLAHRLGFQVESLQAGFPDCEAARQIQPGKWQRVRIEFEYESRNFLLHRHPPEACDVIVCWRHNWPECPETLDVVELRKFVRQV
jgi:Homing endonuclease associated repeat